MKMHVLFAVLIALMLISPTAVQADVLHLTNGSSMEGDIVKESDSEIQIYAEGGIVTFSKADIKNIERAGGKQLSTDEIKSKQFKIKIKQKFNSFKVKSAAAWQGIKDKFRVMLSPIKESKAGKSMQAQAKKASTQLSTAVKLANEAEKAQISEMNEMHEMQKAGY